MFQLIGIYMIPACATSQSSAVGFQTQLQHVNKLNSKQAFANQKEQAPGIAKSEIDLSKLVDGDLLVSKQPVQDLLLVIWEHAQVNCLCCLGHAP